MQLKFNKLGAIKFGCQVLSLAGLPILALSCSDDSLTVAKLQNSIETQKTTFLVGKNFYEMFIPANTPFSSLTLGIPDVKLGNYKVTMSKAANATLVSYVINDGNKDVIFNVEFHTSKSDQEKIASIVGQFSNARKTQWSQASFLTKEINDEQLTFSNASSLLGVSNFSQNWFPEGLVVKVLKLKDQASVKYTVNFNYKLSLEQVVNVTFNQWG